MTVLLRADANDKIGIGHVMRCASLGLRLLRKGRTVHLVSAEIPESLGLSLRNQGFGFSQLPPDCVSSVELDALETRLVADELGGVEWVVVDHYGRDARWESALRAERRRLMVIDDLANRPHDCDVLLDPGMQDDRSIRYAGLVPDGTVMLLGPEYTLLRPEFDDPTLLRPRSGHIAKLLVYFGGGLGIGDEILKVVSAVGSVEMPAFETTVVLGPIESAADIEIEIRQRQPLMRVLTRVDAMASLISHADLAIGTCGSSALERCALGLPALTVVSADNQRDDSVQLARRQAIMHLGNVGAVSEETWQQALMALICTPSAVKSMGLAASSVLAERARSASIVEGIFDDAR